MKKNILLFLLTLLSYSSLLSKNESDYILCINSYTDAFQWSNRIINELTEYTQTDPNISLSIVYMHSLALSSHDDFATVKNYLVKSTTERRPKALVLLGATSFTLRDKYREMWGDIPIILCSSVDYVGPVDAYLNNRLLEEKERVYIADIKDKYNTTYIGTPIFLEDNIQLLLKAYPAINELIFIRDQLQINYELESELNHILSHRYPQIKVESIMPDDLSTYSLLELLNSVDPNRTGILFSSWSFIRELAVGTTIAGNTRELIGTCRNPIFTINMGDIIPFGGKMCAGVSFDFAEFKDHFIDVMNSVLDGAEPRDIPFYTIENKKTYAFYDKASKRGVNLMALPQSTIYLNRPPSFIERNQFEISILLIVVFMLFLFFLFRFRIFKMRETALRKEQAILSQFKHRFDNMSICYSEYKLVYDSNGVVIDYVYTDLNRICANYRMERDKILGKMASTVVPREKFNEVVKVLNQLVQTNEIQTMTMYWPITDNWLYSEFSLSAKKDYVDRYLVDQTELMALKNKAEEADKLKSAFLANMSHEIRTPLNAIVGFSELLQTAEDESEKQEFINIINLNNELLLRLIGDILDLSKIESNSIELKLEPFSLSEMMKELYSNYKICSETSEIKLIMDAPNTDLVITLDRNRVAQIGANLLSNAIKHTHRGYIRIGCDYKDKGLLLYVEDTGMGISLENQSRLFERFEKLDNFTQGTGLGLSICKALIEKMRGKIEVESIEGKGTKFTVWIPCIATKTGNNIADSSQQENDCEFTTTIGISSQKDILVAEDNDSNYRLLESYLKGYRVTRAYNGQEAVEFAKQNYYDLILMDIRMPIMDGIEATKLIRAINKDVTIIAVTANAFDTDREKAIQSGCNFFIAKPLKRKDFESVIVQLDNH
ncbi:MAG: hybrid sensor histidine kinase/response regulator [Phocaeicola sp.]